MTVGSRPENYRTCWGCGVNGSERPVFACSDGVFDYRHLCMKCLRRINGNRVAEQGPGYSIASLPQYIALFTVDAKAARNFISSLVAMLQSLEEVAVDGASTKPQRWYPPKSIVDVNDLLDCLGHRSADIDRMNASESENERLLNDLAKLKQAFSFLEKSEQRALDEVKPLREALKDLRDAHRPAVNASIDRQEALEQIIEVAKEAIER